MRLYSCHRLQDMHMFFLQALHIANLHRSCSNCFLQTKFSYINLTKFLPLHFTVLNGCLSGNGSFELLLDNFKFLPEKRNFLLFEIGDIDYPTLIRKIVL